MGGQVSNRGEVGQADTFQVGACPRCRAMSVPFYIRYRAMACWSSSNPRPGLSGIRSTPFATAGGSV